MSERVKKENSNNKPQESVKELQKEDQNLHVSTLVAIVKEKIAVSESSNKFNSNEF